MGNVVRANLNKDIFEYPFVEANSSDIIDAIGANLSEEAMMKAVVFNMEKQASVAIRNMKCVQLPYIGCIRINPVKRKLKEESTSFRFARKNMTKEQYKDHVRSWVNDIKDRQKEKERFALYISVIRRKNKKKYEFLAMNVGRATAEMFIHSFTLMSIIEFDEEWERHYQSLKD